VAVPTALGVTACEPLLAREPLQSPEAVQLVALMDDQVSVTDDPWVTALAELVKVGAPGGTNAKAASACTKP
jgi:hypothetical protein